MIKSKFMDKNLVEIYRDVCKIFFPRFDHPKDWTVKYSKHDKFYGFCDKKTKTITINKSKCDNVTKLRLVLIHEICHGITKTYHDKAWTKRMIKAAKTAEQVGENALSKLLYSEAKNYKNGIVYRAKDIYNMIEDALMDAPKISFRKLVTNIFANFGMHPEEFNQRYRKSERVYKEQKKLFNES